MLADVTNRAPGARGFQLADGATLFVEPGRTARLDLADHPLHDVWAAAGDVLIVPVDGDAPEPRIAPALQTREIAARRVKEPSGGPHRLPAHRP